VKVKKTMEVAAWKKLAAETRALPQVKTITEEEIEEQIDAYRQFLRDDSPEDEIYEKLR